MIFSHPVQKGYRFFYTVVICLSNSFPICVYYNLSIAVSFMPPNALTQSSTTSHRYCLLKVDRRIPSLRRNKRRLTDQWVMLAHIPGRVSKSCPISCQSEKGSWLCATSTPMSQLTEICQTSQKNLLEETVSPGQIGIQPQALHLV